MSRTPPEIKDELAVVQRAIRRARERLGRESRALERAAARRTGRRVREGLETRYLEAKSAVDGLKRESRILERELCAGWNPPAWGADNVAQHDQ